MATSSLSDAGAIKQSVFRAINMGFPTEDFIENTRYGEQLCTIGVIDFDMPVIIRQALHPSEINPPDVNFDGLLDPEMIRTDQNGEFTFLLYLQNPYYGKFEMTLVWYMKVHRKETKNSFSLTGQYIIEPALVLMPDGKWALSETFKNFLNDIIKIIHQLHEKGYTHGRLLPNNILIKSIGTECTYSSYEAMIVNCIQRHDLEKEEEMELFEALKKKDWEDVVELIENITSDVEDCLDYEFTQFMNKLKISKEQKTFTKDFFYHPALWLRRKKYGLINKMQVKITAEKLSELGFLKAGVDWRKLVHEGILAKNQEEAWGWIFCYRDDYNGEFNDSIQDLLCFIKDTYYVSRGSHQGMFSDELNSMGYTSMDLYLQSLFPNLILSMHQLEGTDAFYNEY